MAELITIARPYAKALFEYALQNHVLEGWEKALHYWSLAVQDPSLASELDNPKISDQQFHELFSVILQKTAPEFYAAHKTNISNFLNILIAEKRLNVLPEIALRYQELLTAEKNMKEVTVVSAFSLSVERQQQLSEALTRYFKTKLSLTFQEDNSLIGGLVIRSGNWVMDDSIKGRLQSLKDEVTRI